MIKRIYIKNFRSIKELDVNTPNLCALIGPNSTGKTNILRALNILLGEVYPTDRAFSKEDFYDRNSEEPITILADLKHPLKPVYATKKVGGKDQCSCVSLQLEYSWSERGAQTHFTCISDNGEEFYGNGAMRDQIAFVYVPSERSFDKQLSISKWTLFGKILSKVDLTFKADPYRVQRFQESMVQPRSILEEPFTQGISYSEFKKVFTSKVLENAKGHLNSLEIDLEIYDPLWFYKMIHITSVEDEKRFNVEEVGAGTQNLILLSLFQTFAELLKENAVLAIEEPELFLFPHAQRHLYREFKVLSDNTQIFYTTHSPYFVDVARCNDTVILRRGSGGTEMLNHGQIEDFLSTDEKNELHLVTRFTPEVNEIFFSDYIVLVEGLTEKCTLPYVLKALLGNRANELNYVIVNCTSKDLIPFFIKVCRFLGIENYLAIYDTDLAPDKNEKALESARKSSKAISDACDNMPERSIALSHDFESACGYVVTRESKKLLDALVWAKSLTKEQVPEAFNSLKTFFKIEEGGIV